MLTVVAVPDVLVDSTTIVEVVKLFTVATCPNILIVFAAVFTVYENDTGLVGGVHDVAPSAVVKFPATVNV